jgi:hypothetical protein
MKNKYLITLLVAVFSCYNVNCEDDLFNKYIGVFKTKSIPFHMDRQQVLDLRNNINSYTMIVDSLKQFIPDELKKTHPVSTFRSLYLFPKKNDITTVLLFQDFINQYEMEVIKSFLVTYNVKGIIIDYQEIAGVNIEVWETFMSVNDNFIFERKNYKFRIHNDKENIKYFSSVETTSKYEIKTDGKIELLYESKIEGYFEGTNEGYKYVKPLIKN